MSTIDLNPTWGEIGLLIARLAVSKEINAFREIRPELARGMAAAVALDRIMPSLNNAQRQIVADTLQTELRKQGY